MCVCVEGRCNWVTVGACKEERGRKGRGEERRGEGRGGDERGRGSIVEREDQYSV